MKQFIKQPLIHFLILAGLLFALFEWSGGSVAGDPNVRTLRIVRSELLTFMQYRAKAFNTKLFSEKLDAMPANERQRLIDDFVREEVLYREAKTMQLGKDDYVIKRRLIQKLEFITKGFSDSITKVNDEQLQVYFDANRQDYYIEPHVTFTHVFFDRERHGDATAKQYAEQKLAELDHNQVSFSEAISHGDRFPYHKNYVERAPEFVASHFGQPMATAIFALNGDDTRWSGPYTSPYGYHLVKVSNRKTGRFPTLEEVAGRVLDDARLAAARDQNEKAIQSIIEGWEIILSDELFAVSPISADQAPTRDKEVVVKP